MQLTQSATAMTQLASTLAKMVHESKDHYIKLDAVSLRGLAQKTNITSKFFERLSRELISQHELSLVDLGDHHCLIADDAFFDNFPYTHGSRGSVVCVDELDEDEAN